MDAGSDERLEPAATGAVSALYGGHEHSAAGSLALLARRLPSASLTSGMENYLHKSSAPTELKEMANAMTFGSQNVFMFAMIVTLIGLALAFFIRRVIVNHATMKSMH